MTKCPKSMRHLDDAIRRACDGSASDYVKLRTLMANEIVAQVGSARNVGVIRPSEAQALPARADET